MATATARQTSVQVTMVGGKIEEFLDEVFNNVPVDKQAKERTPAFAVARSLTPEERVLVSRVVNDKEEPELVAQSMGMTVSRLKSAVLRGLNKLCQNGRGVPTLCDLVKNGRELGYK